MRPLKTEDVVPVLRKALRSVEGLSLAYLFGSLARGASSHDVDIAVLIEGPDKARGLSEVIRSVSRALGIPEEDVDVVDIEGASPLLLHEVLEKGLELFDERGLGKELRKRLTLDYPRMREELDVMTRMWVSEDPEVNRALLARRPDEVLRDVGLLKRYVREGLAWVLSDIERTYAFERALHRAIEAMLDVCRHVVAVEGLGAVEFYSDYPLRLAEAGVMEEGLADKLAELARLRNVLVQGYAELDYPILMQVAEEVVGQVAPAFSSWLKGLLKER